MIAQVENNGTGKLYAPNYDFWNRRKKQRLLAPAIIGLLVLIAFTAYRLFSRPPRVPPPSSVELEDLPGILGSDAYWALSPTKRNQYTRATVESLILRTAAEYCEQPVDERAAYLENLVARAEVIGRRFRGLTGGIRPSRADSTEETGRPLSSGQRREIRVAARSNTSRGHDSGRPGREIMVERIRREAERLDSTSRAQLVKFIMDLQDHLGSR